MAKTLAQLSLSDRAAGKTKEPRYSVDVAQERLAMRHQSGFHAVS